MLHAEEDPVVLPESASLLLERLGSARKCLKMVPGARHGILMDNIGGVWEHIDAFLQEVIRNGQ